MAGVAVALATGAQALDFNVTYGHSTGVADFTADQKATIQQALDEIKGTYTDNVTVNLQINNVNFGLGGSSQNLEVKTYSDFLTHLTNDETSSLDVTAVGSLPGTTPFSGNSYVTLTHAQARALGYTTGGGTDCTISLYSGICFTRSQGPQVNRYDLHAVAEHEIDESMGFGGPGSLINSGYTPTYVGSEDLFRYSAPGTRTNLSYYSPSDYLSFDGGNTSIRGFNNGYYGGDYADWASVTGDPHVQDAFATADTLVNYSDLERTTGDGVGWDLKAVPEPSSMALLGFGAAAFFRRRKKA